MPRIALRPRMYLWKAMHTLRKRRRAAEHLDRSLQSKRPWLCNMRDKRGGANPLIRRGGPRPAEHVSVCSLQYSVSLRYTVLTIAIPFPRPDRVLTVSCGLSASMDIRRIVVC